MSLFFTYLTRSANLPDRIYFANGWSMRHEISGTNGRIFTRFLDLVELSKGLIMTEAILRWLKGRCHGDEQFKTQNRRFSQTNLPFFIVARPFRNGLEYQNAVGYVRNALNVATSCTNLVRFGAVTREIRLHIFLLA